MIRGTLNGDVVMILFSLCRLIFNDQQSRYLMSLFLPRDGFADMRFGIIPCLSTTETPLQVYGMA
jgi:hypothetical protein